MADDLLEQAIAAIDAANADDPNQIRVRGALRPKELAHAELATEWVKRLAPEPSPALCLAVRAHHVRRWVIPRSSKPSGRAGYLRWRRALHQVHADEVGAILMAVGFDTATIEHVQRLVAKRDLGTDPEAQVLEDALCLVFVETQLHDLAARLDRDTMISVIRKTIAKMSPDGIAAAAVIDLAPDDQELLQAALAQ